MASQDSPVSLSEAKPETSFPILSATYFSPNNANFTHTHSLPTLATDKVSERIAYLGELRKATAEMQERMNKELTLRMEEDKAREAEGANGGQKNGGVVDESKEENNYGEEVVEEED